jgi:hypothetical protein
MPKSLCFQVYWPTTRLESIIGTKTMSPKTKFWSFGVLAGTVVILMLGGWIYYRLEYPRGYSTYHYNFILEMALRRYAEEHEGSYPTGKATPEASLSLLYPKYANADVLSGKSVSVQRVQAILDEGKLLDPDSCGWHYVEGLTLNDDRRLALFWDKVGLGDDRQQLQNGKAHRRVYGWTFRNHFCPRLAPFLERTRKADGQSR